MVNLTIPMFRCRYCHKLGFPKNLVHRFEVNAAGHNESWWEHKVCAVEHLKKMLGVKELKK